jgi:hypothetical protein
MTRAAHLGRIAAVAALLFALGACSLWAQQLEALMPWPPQSHEAAQTQQLPETGRHAGPVSALYRSLRTAALDRTMVFHVREAEIDRDELHLFLTDGTIAFAHDGAGRVTGAYFAGEGEVLMRPPDLTEHASLGLFSGLGVLDEHFSAAYLRFNRDMRAELKPYLRESEEQEEFVHSHGERALELAQLDDLRLLESFTEDETLAARDRFLHARLATRLGNLDVYYDSLAEDQFKVESLGRSNDQPYLDVWMAFPGKSARAMGDSRPMNPSGSASALPIESFHIDAALSPPETLEATAELEFDVRGGGERLLVFSLSRRLQVTSVTADGAEVEFLQNEAVSGSELERLGNDIVAVAMSAPMRVGEHHRLVFHYAGAVMQQVAPGLLAVGARGTWYPNLGMQMSLYELTFHWPRPWTLVATGRAGEVQREGEMQVGHWSSEERIPIAGFNLGQFQRAAAQTDGIEVASYSAGIFENSPATREKAAEAAARNRVIAEESAAAVLKYTQWFGTYPYRTLSLTQMPGAISQGWPTLVYLSSLAYMSAADRERLKLNTFGRLITDEFILDHEIAHQWWGDEVGWKNYRDQWLMEALANMSALMLIEEKNPQQARELLDLYRQQLLETNQAGKRYADAGPVTLGYRLSSSVFPNAYIPVTYGRGLWLMVMLRDYFADYENSQTSTPSEGNFLRALREFAHRYAGKTATTDDFRQVLEEFLPQSARFEDKRTLSWFFDEWVRGSSVPQITLRHANIRKRGESTVASFDVHQEACPDSLITSVPIFAELPASKRIFVQRIFADGHDSHFELKVPAGTRRLLIDPNRTLLRAN